MTSITRNLPWFIKDLGISIVGKECYTSLVENLDMGDVQCIKYSLSKGLGIGIVVGGSVMKVPQILLIINARSARGLSFSSYILETLSYAITLAYSFRNEFPFSTYGENLFLTIQNTVVTLLILAYAPSSLRSGNKAQKIAVAIFATIATAFALYVIPSQTLSLLQMSTLPLSLFSKLPQIRQNARTQSTGQLSAVAVIAQVAGCLARLFTTATEVGDAIVSAGFALALLLNIVLGAQLYMYWGKSDVTESHELGKAHGYIEVEKVKEQESPAPAVYEPASWQQQTPQQRVATPPPRTPSSASGRKWARKVD
ncbi:uncharacterized protein LACBIDRAFT_231097 [Laccaria bicolor S238N-H82]|uniref:Predicted protein n=1 Tax=Laccaria bicolor (strain S238N-H82 / ATCC MYA-4686) TaxID=486041 RepID=B0CXK6_LACBS|nr:uncharacterized protein LACBIDRAFT_231097 [Laccaria bicolor S238N-H82]EDR12739.1 predicted protein [Laccaria bicolor S238N-H82]|eukprot:XP_001877003.1 predicted protein [Laccaria bicolor S238N-H82]